MVSVVALALWCGRIASPSRTLALALAVVVAADPWAPLAPGFWLSFGAVALIFYVAAGWTRGASLQWVPHAMGDHRRPRARGAAALRPGLGRRAARQRGRDPGGVGGRDAARAACRGAAPASSCCKPRRGWSNGCCSSSNGARRCPARCGSSTCRRCGPSLLALAGAAWLLAPRGVPWRAGGLALMAPAFALAPPAPRRGRGLDHRARRRPGARGAGAHREPHAALRRRARPTAPRPTAAGASSCRCCAAPGIAQPRPAGAQPRGHRPSRRRAHGARDASKCDALASSLPRGHPLHCAGRRAARAARAGSALGMGRRALRVPASAAGLGSGAAQQPELRAARRSRRRRRCCSPATSSAPRRRLLRTSKTLKSRRAAGPAPRQPHLVERRVHRRRGAALGGGAGGLPQPLRPSGARGARALRRGAGCGCCAPIWTARSRSS